MTTSAVSTTWGTPFTWQGFSGREGDREGINLKVIFPDEPRPGRPWVWKTEFLDAFANAEPELLRRGFALVHLELFDNYGCPKAVARGLGVHEFVTRLFGFSEKVCLLGMSRGGLWAYNWAIRHPDKTALVYADNPVCDFKSWPGGFGAGPGSPEDWAKCLTAYGLSEEEAMAWPQPLERLEVLAEAGIPILQVYGDADEVVPVEENALLVRDRYRALGGPYEEVVKPGGLHHPHGFPDDPSPIIRFFERYGV